MQIQDWLMILAVLLGPIIAVRITRHLDDRKEIRDRKLQVFKTLMASRAHGISPLHVEALNRIDLEFNTKNKNDKQVVAAWKEYLDLLGDKSISSEQWKIRRNELLVDLLHKMAHVLKYDFDKVHIKNSVYYPEAHGNMEEQLNAIRNGLVELLDGRRIIPMHVTNFSQQEVGEETTQIGREN